MLQWRPFHFYDMSLVEKEGLPPNTPHPDLQKIDVSSSASGAPFMILGDTEGYVHLVDKDFNAQRFKAFDKDVLLMEYLHTTNKLAAVGKDQQGPAYVKIFDLNEPKLGRFGKIESYANIVCPIFSANYAERKINCMWVKDDLTVLVVGLANGDIVKLSGEMKDDKFQRLKLQFTERPIHSIALIDEGLPEDEALMMVVTDQEVVRITGYRPDSKQTLDAVGANPGCSILLGDGSERNPIRYLVGSFDGVYFYNIAGKDQTLGFEGTKKIVMCDNTGNNLLVVQTHDKQDPREDLRRKDQISIYDLSNKFKSFYHEFSEVRQVVLFMGTWYVIQGDGKIYELREKEVTHKLNTLYSRDLYQTAVKMAMDSGFEENFVVDIYRKHADHLYSKGDYDGSMVQYLKTIPQTEPSYVIQKFLDAQRIHNLTSYLQALHEKEVAHSDHTTLLLNCYTKLQDVKKLEDFIKHSHVKFEVETAIKVCKGAGYLEYAVYLAEKHQEHAWWIMIKLYEQDKAEEVLDYIANLDFWEAEKNLKKHGKYLLKKSEERTTNMLIELCTSPKERKPKYLRAREKPTYANPTDFIDLFVDKSDWLIIFLEFVLSKDGEPGYTVSNTIYNEVLELYLAPHGDMTLLLDPHMRALPESDARRVEAVSSLRHKKAMGLLLDPKAHYDVDHALFLCQVNNFVPGQLFLYEKNGLYHDILFCHMGTNAYANVIEACEKFGDKEPSLWIHALEFFACATVDVRIYIADILTNIEQKELLPPLIVVQILSAHPNATVDYVKDYLIRQLQKEQRMTAEDQKLIKTYREDQVRMQTEIEEIRTSARIFQSSKCSACGAPLDLPAFHFLCMHSFHHRCLGENEQECPVCEAENMKVAEMNKALLQKPDLHDQFFKQLETAHARPRHETFR